MRPWYGQTRSNRRHRHATWRNWVRRTCHRAGGAPFSIHRRVARGRTCRRRSVPSAGSAPLTWSPRVRSRRSSCWNAHCASRYQTSGRRCLLLSRARSAARSDRTSTGWDRSARNCRRRRWSGGAAAMSATGVPGNSALRSSGTGRSGPRGCRSWCESSIPRCPGRRDSALQNRTGHRTPLRNPKDRSSAIDATSHASRATLTRYHWRPARPDHHGDRCTAARADQSPRLHAGWAQRSAATSPNAHCLCRCRVASQRSRSRQYVCSSFFG